MLLIVCTVDMSENRFWCLTLWTSITCSCCMWMACCLLYWIHICCIFCWKSSIWPPSESKMTLTVCAASGSQYIVQLAAELSDLLGLLIWIKALMFPYSQITRLPHLYDKSSPINLLLHNSKYLFTCTSVHYGISLSCPGQRNNSSQVILDANKTCMSWNVAKMWAI